MAHMSIHMSIHISVHTEDTWAGTVAWAAPEVLNGSVYAEPADVFSFGIVLWELVSRQVAE